MSEDKFTKEARRLLEAHFWPPELKPHQAYTRLHDDHDGTKLGTITVLIGSDGDAYVTVNGAPGLGALRFRTGNGGGNSLRVRTALVLLALAIKLDSEERP